MKIDIYTSIKDGSKHLSVPKGTKIEEVKLSKTIDADLLSLSPFKTRLEIIADKKHNTLNQKDIIKQIEKKGYAIHSAKTVITLSVDEAS